MAPPGKFRAAKFGGKAHQRFARAPWAARGRRTASECWLFTKFHRDATNFGFLESPCLGPSH